MRLALKTILSAALGALLGFLLIILAGILRIRHEGLQSGILFDLFSRQLPSITNPQVSILPLAGIAALSALILSVLVLPRRHLGHVALNIGFLSSALIFVIWGIALGPNLGLYYDLTVRDGVAPGVTGWLQYGSTEPSVYLVMVLSFGALILREKDDRVKEPKDPAVS